MKTRAMPAVSARSAGAGLAVDRLAVDRRRRPAPARQQTARLRRLRARLGGVGDDPAPGVGEDLEPVEAELELAHDRVVEPLDALRVQPDVVRGPQPAELVALRGELADQVREASVVRVAAGLGAEDRYRLPGGAIPVGVEGARVRIEEDEPPPVAGLPAAAEQR